MNLPEPWKVDPETLRQASEHLIKAGGKKLRPALAILSAQAVGGEVKCPENWGCSGTDPHLQPNPRRHHGPR